MTEAYERASAESLASIAKSLEFFRTLAVAALEQGAKSEPEMAQILSKLPRPV